MGIQKSPEGVNMWVGGLLGFLAMLAVLDIATEVTKIRKLLEAERVSKP